LKKTAKAVISGNCITSADGPAKQESDTGDAPRPACGETLHQATAFKAASAYSSPAGGFGKPLCNDPVSL